MGCTKSSTAAPVPELKLEPRDREPVYLSKRNNLELFGQDATGPRFSIRSEVVKSDRCKRVSQEGDEVDPGEFGLGFVCRQGRKPGTPNQDSWSIMHTDNRFSIYAVFDGHGKHGHFISDFVKDRIPTFILTDARFRTPEMSEMLQDSFKRMQTLLTTADSAGVINSQHSGTTASLVIHDAVDRRLLISHVGNSTCVMGSVGPDGWKSRVLTHDHKPELPAERERIEQAGARVLHDGYAAHRVYTKSGPYPGLSVSRCLGNLAAHAQCGLTAEPDVSVIQFLDDDKVLLLCSKGVWEFITAEEAVTMMRDCAGSPPEAKKAAEALAQEAWNRWIAEEDGTTIDDITVLAISLQPEGGGWSLDCGASRKPRKYTSWLL